MAIPTSLSSKYGHQATIVPVRKLGGRMEGKWQVRVERGDGQRPKVVYSDPYPEAARRGMAKYLNIPEQSIKIYYNGASIPNSRVQSTPVTPASSDRAGDTGRPFDTFEPRAPTSLAICKACKMPILKDTSRIGIQQWHSYTNGWKPAYYHRSCCSDNVILAMNLPTTGNGDSAPSSAAKKLRDELERQMDVAATNRHLVYGERKELREDLRRLRLMIAGRDDVPAFMIFDDATLDAIVAKGPSTMRELMQCRGIGPKRCRDYGQAIFEVVSRHEDTRNV